jgi:hypothetical protein
MFAPVSGWGTILETGEQTLEAWAKLGGLVVPAVRRVGRAAIQTDNRQRPSSFRTHAKLKANS